MTKSITYTCDFCKLETKTAFEVSEGALLPTRWHVCPRCWSLALSVLAPDPQLEPGK